MDFPSDYMSIIGCEIFDNIADIGGGIHISDKAFVVLSETLVCSNAVGQIEGPWTDDGANEIYDECSNDCPGDYNGDGHVGVDDLLTVIAGWQNPYTVDDLLLVISSWGPCE